MVYVCVINLDWFVGMMCYSFCGGVEIVVMLEYMVVFLYFVDVVYL